MKKTDRHFNYLLPSKRVGLLEHNDVADGVRVPLLPPAAGEVVAVQRVPAHRLVRSPVEANVTEIVRERLLAGAPGDWPGVEGVGQVVCTLVPVEEGPGGDLELPRGEEAAGDLHDVAPGDGDGPLVRLVVADGLLHYAGGVVVD